MKMKLMKLTAALIASLFLAVGCASSNSIPASSGVNTGPSRMSKGAGGDELENALREISDYLNKRIKEGSKAVFLNIKSDWPDFSDYILSTLAENAVNDEVFSVVDRQQLDAIRSELNFQWSGEVSDDSAQEIGKMLGAQSIVSGAVTTIGSVYRIQVRAIAVQTASVQGQFSKNVSNKDATVASLTKRVVPAGSGDSGGTATASGTRTQPAAPVVQPAQTAAIKAGTYTFYPRLRASRGGVDINDYIVQIVVRGNYFIVYMTDKPLGKGNAYANSSGWNYKDRVLLQDVDRPSRAYNMVNHSLDENGNQLLTFQNVTGSKFNLINTEREPNVIFEGITIGEPDK
jgi:hypothetical protein